MKILIVGFHLNPDFRDQFMKASLGDAQGANRDEPGCLRFDMIQDEKDPNRIYFYKWRDTIDQTWYAEPVEVVRGFNVYPPDGEWK